MICNAFSQQTILCRNEENILEMLRRYYLQVKRTEQIEKWIAEEQKNRANQEKLFWWLMSSYFELSFINIKISIKLTFSVW